MGTEKLPEEGLPDPGDQEELYEHHRIVADRGQEPLRIDKFLVNRLPDTSRNRIQNACDEGCILVNGKAVKSNYKIKPGDTIQVVLPEPVREIELVPQDLPLDIVYEDDDLIIVNKAAGMVVHPAYGNYTGTLMNALVFHFSNLPVRDGMQSRPGLVHRIDKNTSGLLVVAKSETAMVRLAREFFERTIERRYLALVWGDFSEEEGTVRGHIGRNLKDRKIMQVFPGGELGKPAVTHYRVVERFGYVTLLECRLETGRTHQIRVHLQHIGHPLFNDAEYGGDRILKGTTFSKYKQFVTNCFSLIPGQALHARSIGFLHPRTDQRLLFESALPEGFQAILDKWRNYAKSSGDR
jgi:23S rRNA pseudouridine1911/1915/1917 synthase